MAQHRRHKPTIRQRLNAFVYEEFGINSRDLDIRFKLGGSRYRIPQFTVLWTILEAIFVAAVSFGIYAWIVLMILMGDVIGGI